MNGFLNIIKPTGVSSGLIVNKVKKITGEKVGHLGTLDPAASGVLTLAIGKVTRFFDYFLNKDKEYIALAKFGVLTDTLDADGMVLKREEKQISFEEVAETAKTLIGQVDQIPPIFSSKNIGGQRAYDLARSGNEVVLKPKKVQIYDIKVEKTAQNNLFKLKIHCSSGTYVRSIVRDIAQKLGTIATTVCIIRTKSGVFKIEDAYTFDEIKDNVSDKICAVGDIMPMQKIVINNKIAKDLYNGKSVQSSKADGEYLLIYNDKEFAVAECFKGCLKKKIYLYEGEING